MEKEVEHKYLVTNFSPKDPRKAELPVHHDLIWIVQHYLENDNNPTERIRSLTRFEICGMEWPGRWFTHTIKYPAEDEGNWEAERIIEEDEYGKLLTGTTEEGGVYGRQDLTRQPIFKYRYVFFYKDQKFELDRFVGPISFTLLEAEVKSLSDPIELPPFLDLIEVTGDKRFSSNYIAKKPHKTLERIKVLSKIKKQLNPPS